MPAYTVTLRGQASAPRNPFVVTLRGGRRVTPGGRVRRRRRRVGSLEERVRRVEVALADVSARLDEQLQAGDSLRQVLIPRLDTIAQQQDALRQVVVTLAATPPPPPPRGYVNSRICVQKTCLRRTAQFVLTL